MTTSSTPASAWTGRHDGDGPEHARWHQAVQVVRRGEADGDGPSGEVAEAGAAVPDPAAEIGRAHV